MCNIFAYAEKESQLSKVDDKVYKIIDDSPERLEVIKGSSLFHKKSDLTKLYNILDLIRKGIDPSQELLSLNEGDDIEEKKISKTSMSFYLNAILYYSSSKWSLWVNNKKITQDENNTDLEIMQINPNYIEFRWVTGYSKFVTALQKHYNEKKSSEYIDIDINDGIAIIDFKIKPNQSLTISDKVVIKEGRDIIQ